MIHVSSFFAWEFTRTDSSSRLVRTGHSISETPGSASNDIWDKRGIPRTDTPKLCRFHALPWECGSSALHQRKQTAIH